MKFKARKKSKLPELDLKQADFGHQVPDDQEIYLTVIWKDKLAANEQIGPVKIFGIKDGKLKIVNRALPDVAYTFYVKELRKVIVL